MSTETPDRPRRSSALSGRWIAAGLVVLFVAYVCGRAAGILLDVNPYLTEIAAIVIVAAGLTAARRGS